MPIFRIEQATQNLTNQERTDQSENIDPVRNIIPRSNPTSFSLYKKCRPFGDLTSHTKNIANSSLNSEIRNVFMESNQWSLRLPRVNINTNSSSHQR